MTLHVCVLGIDGSGKSTISVALPAVWSGRIGGIAGSCGDVFQMLAPEEDCLTHGFSPDGLPVSARLSNVFRRLAKRASNRRNLYPPLKVTQMLFQDRAERMLSRRYKPALVVSDGNALLSATGRAGNYLRPASEGSTRRAPQAEDLAALFRFLLEGEPLPAASRERLPPLQKARALYRLMEFLGFRALWLPDVVIFLDLSPDVAVTRISARSRSVDRHENLADLAQSREMYLKTLDAFRRYRSDAAVIRISTDDLSPGEILQRLVTNLESRLSATVTSAAPRSLPLGTTGTRLTRGGVWSKTLNFRYIFRYLLPRWFSGAWREPTFPISELGRLFLRQGYSAGVMRAIYDRDHKEYGLLDRIFLEYPLHRAVYDRLKILVRLLESELETRLKHGRELSLLTAPSGFAYDLFQSLESIGRRNREAMRRVRLIAADLDPQDVLARELGERSRRLGIQFEFVKGDLTAESVRDRLRIAGPYDLALFVGLSAWIPKPQLLRHFEWLAENLTSQGILVSDCFTATTYALSGRYIGYKANYYTPQVYRAILDFCGFDGLQAHVESGRDAINHVIVAAPGNLL